jgi:phage protein D
MDHNEEQIVADISVKVDREELSPTVRASVLEISVEEALNMSSSFTIKLDSWGMDRLRVTFMDEELFAIGHRVEISMGYLDGPMRQLIIGSIQDLQAQFDDQSTPVLTVTGSDFSALLARTPGHSETHTGRDSEIATKIITLNNLSAEVHATPIDHERVTQGCKTDLEFLYERARSNGYQVRVDDRTVYFGPSPLSETPTLELGRQLLSFSPTVRGSGVFKEIKVLGSDTAQPSQPDFEAVAPQRRWPGIMPFDHLDEPRRVIQLGPNRREEADLLARVARAERASAVLTASARCRGNATLRAGQVVTVEGVGERFGGSYRIDRVTHSFSEEGGFTSSLQLSGFIP